LSYRPTKVFNLGYGPVCTSVSFLTDNLKPYSFS